MNTEFSHIIDENSYQVFLFGCPGCIPFNFGLHPWFVLNKKGTLSRWEISHRKIRWESAWGHLYKDFLPLFQGISIIPYVGISFWHARLLGQVEGEIAEKMIEFIEHSPQNYPYCEKYFLTGPNSNTYAQWVLNNFPESGITLPKNAFGKNYKK